MGYGGHPEICVGLVAIVRMFPRLLPEDDPHFKPAHSGAQPELPVCTVCTALAPNDNGSIRRGGLDFEGVLARGMNSDSYPLPDAPAYQFRGRTGVHRGPEAAGHRGPWPRAHWSSAERREPLGQGSASHWHPTGSPPARWSGSLQGERKEMCLCVHITPPPTLDTHTHASRKTESGMLCRLAPTQGHYLY